MRMMMNVVVGMCLVDGKGIYSEFKFLYTESTLEDVVRLLTTDSGEDRDVFVSSDTEATDGVSG